MITVRFPSGHSVTYNNAEKVEEHGDVYWLLNGGGFVLAIVKGSALIEYVRPCKVQFGRDDEVITAVLADLRKYPQSKLAELKLALRQFNAHTGVWKP